MANAMKYMQWLEQYKPGTAQWINNRGGWDKLKPKAKRAIKQQIREQRRAMGIAGSWVVDRIAVDQEVEGIITRARRRYLLQAASERRKALIQRDGSQGAASAVRRIDPLSIDVSQYLK
jgi:hypothetical protein